MSDLPLPADYEVGPEPANIEVGSRRERGHIGFVCLGGALHQRSGDDETIVNRAHTRVRMGMSDAYLHMFTKPLVRRLRLDSHAVEALKTAVRKPMDIHEDSPIFTGGWDPISDVCPDLQPFNACTSSPSSYATRAH